MRMDVCKTTPGVQFHRWALARARNSLIHWELGECVGVWA